MSFRVNGIEYSNWKDVPDGGLSGLTGEGKRATDLFCEGKMSGKGTTARHNIINETIMEKGLKSPSLGKFLSTVAESVQSKSRPNTTKHHTSAKKEIPRIAIIAVVFLFFIANIFNLTWLMIFLIFAIFLTIVLTQSAKKGNANQAKNNFKKR